MQKINGLGKVSKYEFFFGLFFSVFSTKKYFGILAVDQLFKLVLQKRLKALLLKIIYLKLLLKFNSG